MALELGERFVQLIGFSFTSPNPLQRFQVRQGGGSLCLGAPEPARRLVAAPLCPGGVRQAGDEPLRCGSGDAAARGAHQRPAGAPRVRGYPPEGPHAGGGARHEAAKRHAGTRLRIRAKVCCFFRTESPAAADAFPPLPLSSQNATINAVAAAALLNVGTQLAIAGSEIPAQAALGSALLCTAFVLRDFFRVDRLDEFEKGIKGGGGPPSSR